jgi:hypothetical protein
MKCAACGMTEPTSDMRFHDHLPHGKFVYIGSIREEFPVVGGEKMVITTKLYACPQCGTIRAGEQ